MAKRRFAQLLDEYPRAIYNYCQRLGWDYDRFRVSISDEGLSHPDLYLEDPNMGIIDKLSQFLEPTNQSSVFIIWDEVGMGKSSIRDFVSRSLDEMNSFQTILVTDPRMTSLQILRLIAREIGAEIEIWNDRGKVKKGLWAKLMELAEGGKSVIIWVDEAEKIDNDIISELRALSDIKTPSGKKACKIILSGTPRLMQKLEHYIDSDPEDATAFDDRASLNTFRLHRWRAEDIYNYWKLLSAYCGKRNPFTKEAADTVFQISEGKPRTIAQVTKLAFNLKAMEMGRDGSGRGLSITSEQVLKALKEHLGD
jgi:type II secretory pathway predicted ATPase ExeA